MTSKDESLLYFNQVIHQNEKEKFDLIDKKKKKVLRRVKGFSFFQSHEESDMWPETNVTLNICHLFMFEGTRTSRTREYVDNWNKGRSSGGKVSVFLYS